MRVLTYLMFVVAGFLALGGCARTEVQELKSPCVSADTGAPGAVDPCGPKRRVNDAWLHS